MLQFEASELEGMLVPIANAWLRDGSFEQDRRPVFFRWLARQGQGQGQGTGAQEGDLLAFAIE